LNFDQIMQEMQDIKSTPHAFDLEHSALNPVRGAEGETRVLEGLAVALRRLGILQAALAHPEPVHPCVTAEELLDTVRAELFELEAILTAVVCAAHREAAPAEPAQ